MRAAGMTKGKILMPFMIISLGVSIAIYLVAQNITPYTNRDFKKKLQFLTSSGLISEIKEGQFFTLIPRLTLFSSKVSDKGKTLKNVFLRLEDDKGDKVIFSQNGTLLYERDQKTLVESLKLQLFDGNIITQKNQSPEIEKIVFKSYLLPITQSKFSNKITPRETMLNGNELAQAIKLTQDQAKEKNRFNQKDRFNAFYEYWNRKNVPLLILLMTFLGFSLGIKENRGKSKNSAVMALLCLVFYYTLLFSLVSIARSGKIPVHLSMVIPNILIFSFALFQYKKLDWQ
jgi:lipopolysaccharide export system permease protein